MINPKDIASRGIRRRGESDDSRYAWTVPSDLAYFDGHFPGAPTLPGVAMIDLTLELVRRRPGFECAELASLKSAKFMAVIAPGDEVEVTLTREESRTTDDKGWRADWKTLNKPSGTLVPAASFLLSVRG